MFGIMHQRCVRSIMLTQYGVYYLMYYDKIFVSSIVGPSPPTLGKSCVVVYQCYVLSSSATALHMA